MLKNTRVRLLTVFSFFLGVGICRRARPNSWPIHVLVVIRFPTTRFDSLGTPHRDEIIGDLRHILFGCAFIKRKRFVFYLSKAMASGRFLFK